MQHWPGGRTELFEGIRLHGTRTAVDVYAPTGRRSVTAGLRVGLELTWALARSRRDFDVVDCSLYPFFHVFGARAVRPRTALVVTWYEYWGDHWYEYLGRRGLVGKHVERLAAAVPRRIVSVSDLTTSALLEAGVPARRVTTVPLGVDTAWVDSIPPARDESDVVFFGRLKNHKNVDLLLRALAVVKSRRPRVRCAVIGDGPERERLERLAGELGLDGSVRFHGELSDEDVIATAKASKVFVHPSTKEGGGSIALLEANACGLPAIAIRHPLGIDSSLVLDGETGWWVDEPAPDALASAISSALDDQAVAGRRPARSDACRAFARGYDWDRVATRCEEIYRDAVAPVLRHQRVPA